MAISLKLMTAVRIFTLLFPPLGLVLLWRFKGIGLLRKLFGTLGILLYTILYGAGIAALLMHFTGLEVEWQGGFPPVLTWHKTHPNYEAVEANRKAQAAKPLVITAAPQSAEWPGFRGPNRDGRYDGHSIVTNWPAAGLTPLWKQPVGGGYASFAIAGNCAFTIEQRREDEAVTAYDVQTGRELWATPYPADFDESMGGEGPRATPTFEEGRLYSQGAMGDMLCLDAATGKIIWRVNILTENQGELLHWATASSPLIVHDTVIVEAGGPRGKSIVAYDKRTGKPAWHVLDDQAAYSSAMLVALAGKEQLLVVTENRAVGLEPLGGALLWTTPWVVKLGNRNIAQPVLLSSNRFMLSAGYGTGCEAVEISRTTGGFSANTVWRTTALKNKFSSSIFWRGFVYGLDEDMLVCLDAQSGERKWKDGRYGYGQIIGVDDYLIVLSGEGALALVRAIPDHYEELARFQAIEGKTWNHPAMAGGKILVRNAVQMACFDLRPAK